MPVLNWDKPEKVLTTEQWQESGIFDGGPTGGFIPNMSEEDAMKWKAKLVGKTTDHPQVEIRKSFHGAQILIIVCLDNGYNYKYYKVAGDYGRTTKGINIHFSANGAVQMVFAEMEELHEAIKEAKAVLEALPKKFHATVKLK